MCVENPREFRGAEREGRAHLASVACPGWDRRSKGRGMRIAQRVTKSGSAMALSLDRDGGNPREFAEKRSGVLQWIHPVSWLRRPHTVSGSRTEPAGGYKLERVCDLRFFVVRMSGPLRLSVGGVARRSPEQWWAGRFSRGFRWDSVTNFWCGPPVRRELKPGWSGSFLLLPVREWRLDTRCCGQHQENPVHGCRTLRQYFGGTRYRRELRGFAEQPARPGLCGDTVRSSVG